MVLAVICRLKGTEHLNRVKPCISGESYKRACTCLTLEPDQGLSRRIDRLLPCYVQSLSRGLHS